MEGATAIERASATASSTTVSTIKLLVSSLELASRASGRGRSRAAAAGGGGELSAGEDEGARGPRGSHRLAIQFRRTSTGQRSMTKEIERAREREDGRRALAPKSVELGSSLPSDGRLSFRPSPSLPPCPLSSQHGQRERCRYPVRCVRRPCSAWLDQSAPRRPRAFPRAVESSSSSSSC